MKKKLFLYLLFLFFIACNKVDIRSDDNYIISVSIPNISAQVNIVQNTITVKVAKNVDLSSLVPIIEVSPHAMLCPSSGLVQNFFNSIEYVVTSESGQKKIYYMSVDNTLSSEAKILNFEFENITQYVEKDEFNIYVYTPNYVNISSLQANIVISDGATVTPASGETVSFNEPENFTVTSSNGTIRNYLVTVKRSPWRCLVENGKAPFLKVDGHRLVVHNGYIWLLGGWLGGNHSFPNPSGDYWTSQVWRSKDGISWENMGDAPWSPRHGFGCVSFKNKIWVISGDSNRDIWSSTDGEIWINENSNVPFNWRYFPYVVVFKDKLWLIGGKNGWWNNFEVYNDVWSSEDGVLWVQEIRTAAFAARSLISGSVVLQDNLYIIGGGMGGPIERAASYNDVWKSFNGIDFRSTTIDAPFKPLYWHSIGVLHDKMYVLGGMHRGDIHTNEVWYSPDGSQWTQQKYTFWTPRHATSTVEFEGKLYMIGGTSDPISARNTMNDVWVMDGDFE